MNLDDAEIRAALSDERPAQPLVHTARWVASGVVVVAVGIASATSHAQVPLLSYVDFGVHELGHLVMGWTPWLVMVAAGSFFQVAVPLALAVYFAIVRRENWAAAPLLAWAGSSARNVAVYIADAPYQRIELWGGDNVVHDWAQLLAGTPIQHAAMFGWLANALGWLLIAGGLVLVVAGALTERRAAAAVATREAREARLPVREPRRPVGG